MQALPWVLLGRRVAFQPHLDSSAAQMVLGMSPKIPGQLLGHPGPPLNTIQLKGLLDQLYKMHDNPPVPTSGKRESLDISETERATHVYVKVDSPQSLCPKFEGPYEIYSRPSRSQVELKIGMFKDGRPRLLTFHWSSCQIAHLREGDEAASRPALGRKPKATSHLSVPTYGPAMVNRDNVRNTSVLGDAQSTTEHVNKTFLSSADPGEMSTNEPAKIQTPERDRPIRSTRNPSPAYVHAFNTNHSPQNVVRW